MKPINKTHKSDPRRNAVAVAYQYDERLVLYFSACRLVRCPYPATTCRACIFSQNHPR